MLCYVYVLTEEKCVERQRFLDTPPTKECEMCLWKKKKKNLTQPEKTHRCCTRE